MKYFANEIYIKSALLCLIQSKLTGIVSFLVFADLLMYNDLKHGLQFMSEIIEFR